MPTAFAAIAPDFELLSVRSKTEIARTNELLRKVLCHNICYVIQSFYELGIPLEFGASAECLQA